MGRRVLILGAAGMLGHKLCQVLRDRFETWATLRSDPQPFLRYGQIEADRLIGHVDGQEFDSVTRAVEQVRPDVVVNAVGIVKQLAAAKDPVPCLTINSLLPHRLAALCRAHSVRLIHLSTDCVFSGRRGAYTEQDVPDAEDLYGRSKLVGEVTGPGCLTLRTSIVGRELHGSHGLLEQLFLRRGGTMPGYRRAIFSGLTTLALSELIARLIESQPDLCGLWHVSSDPIDKYRLLGLVNKAFALGVRLEPNDEFCCDRSLESGRFRQATGYVPPAWPDLVDQMRRDPFPYDDWRMR